MKTLKTFTILVFILLSASLNAQQGGYALHFDGTDDHVDCGNSSSFYMNGGSAITIEAWIYTKNINQDWQAIAGKQIPYNGVYSIIIESNSKKVAFYLNLGGTWLSRVNSITQLEQDKWYHVAATYNGSSAKMYINGKLDNSAACSGTISDNSSVSFYIGKNNNVCFNGNLDEIRVWNIARSEAEIKTNMYKEIGTHANLKAYYKMSNGTGTSLTDNSGNSNTGTLTNGPVWKASGCFAGSRQALDFDGLNDYINIPANSAYNTNMFTVEFWVKANSSQVGNFRGIVDKGRYTGSGQSSQDWYFITYAGNGVIILGLPGVGEVWFGTDGNWHHITGTYDGTTLRGYLDGVLDNDLPTGTRSSPSANGITVGCTQSNDYYFNGQIDELRLWNTARTATEIREGMFRTISGNETNLVAYYPFDHKDGMSLFDLTSTANNGTLANMDGTTDWVSSTAFNTWLGGESNSWATAGNWSSGVPTSAQSAGIYNWSIALPSVTTSLPVLPATVSVNNLLVTSDISSSGNVNLAATGSVFLGSNLTLSSATLNTAGNLAIESGKTLTIPTSGQLTVSNSLANSAGNTGLLIESGGSLIHNSNSVAATVKREITGSSTLTQNKYHFVGIPTQYASPTANLFLGSYLYTLDPNQLNENSSYGKWVGLGTSTTTLLANDKGYMVYYPDASTTYTFEGNLNNGTFNYSLNGHTGVGVYTFNLIPNPYPSAVKWNTAGTGWTESAGVGGTCYIWDASTGNYSNIASSETSYIPAGQALMVAVSNESSPTLSVNNNARIHSTQAFYKSVSEVENQLVIKANANNYADETVVKFAENATVDFDLQIDGLKINGLEDAPQLCTRIGETRFSINNLPALQGQRIVDMNFSTQFAGQITFSASGIESFDPSINIYLKDELANQTINLRNQAAYTFNHNPANDASRFKLIFGGTYGIEEDESLAGNMWVTGNTLYINTPKLAGEKAIVEVYNAAGQSLLTKNLVLNGLTTLDLNMQGFVIVKLTSGQTVLTSKGILIK
jgi:hypothetical protein